MAKVVKVVVGGKKLRLGEAELRAMARKDQIAVAVALGLKLQRGVSKNGLVGQILAK
jgi:hypothetical protein